MKHRMAWSASPTIISPVRSGVLTQARSSRMPLKPSRLNLAIPAAYCAQICGEIGEIQPLHAV